MRGNDYEVLLVAASRLPEDFRFEVKDGGHNLYFNSGYHHFTPDDLVTALCQDFIFGVPNAKGLIRAWEEGKPVTEPCIPFSISRWHHGHEKCSDCGHRDFYTDGYKIWPSRPCPIPEGIALKVEVPIPSGRLMVGNDFRDEFPVAENDFDVNEASEIARYTQAYAEVGMFHFFVGNSCPGVYRKEDGSDHFVIANPVHNEDDSENECHPIPGFAMEPVASVCTDLWWVSIVDAGEAEKRGLSNDGPGTSNDIIEVEPGTYELEYHGLKRNFDRDSNIDSGHSEGFVRTPVIYATLTRRNHERQVHHRL